MRLTLDQPGDTYLIRGYGEGYVTVNDQRIGESLLVGGGSLETRWPPATFDALEPAHFEQILEFDPEIVILGTGATQRFPHPRLTRALIDRHIGVEVMDTAAACRTYNIVVAEGRRVVAALLMI